MESRFGFKDLINIVLLLTVVLLLVLKMIQDDRQWAQLQRLNEAVTSQGSDIAAIRRALGNGISVNPHNPEPRNGNTQADASDDPFARLRRAMKQPDYATGDWCIDAFSSEINTLTPLVSSDTYASVVQGQVLETLANLDPNTLKWQPLLATSWRTIDNTQAYFAWRQPMMKKLLAQARADPSVYAQQLEAVKADFKSQLGREVKEGTEEFDQLKDAAISQWVDQQIDDAPDRPIPLRIEFTMRPGVTFSDGTPLTAHDVEFSYDLIMNPKVAAPRERSYYGRIMQSVKAEGDDKVMFTYRRPYFQALELAAGLNVLPKHYYKPIVDQDPETFNQSKGLLVGSGPYMLPDPKGWQPSGQIILVRNERYWGPAAPLNRLVFRIFTSDQAKLVAFKNREIDLFGAYPEQYVEMLKDKELAKRADHYEYMTPYNGYRFIAWNQLNDSHQPSRFADKRVRQAMTMLLDRPRMLQEVMLGYGQVCDGPFNPLGEQSAPDVKPWPHDVARAKQLLKEAGYEDRNNDGVIEGPDGKPFQFKLTYPSGNPNYQKMVFYVKDALAAAGIVLQADPLEWSVMVDRLNNHNFEAITLGWTSGPESDINQMFSSDQIRPGGDNFIAYRNSQLDQLITQSRQTVDEKSRMQLWHKCHEILHEDQPYTFLFWGKSLRFLDNRFKNVELLKAGLNPRTEWYVPKDLQHWTE